MSSRCLWREIVRLTKQKNKKAKKQNRANDTVETVGCVFHTNFKILGEIKKAIIEMKFSNVNFDAY